MTYRQKTIITLWMAILISLVLLAIFDDWVLENWDAIRWPSLIVIFIIAGLSQSKNPSSLDHGRNDINEIVSSHPWIKLYIAIYCLIVAVTCFVVLSKGINISESVGTVELMASVFGIMLPVIIVQQIRLYKSAGKQI